MRKRIYYQVIDDLDLKEFEEIYIIKSSIFCEMKVLFIIQERDLEELFVNVNGIGRDVMCSCLVCVLLKVSLCFIY